MGNTSRALYGMGEVPHSTRAKTLPPKALDHQAMLLCAECDRARLSAAMTAEGYGVVPTLSLDEALLQLGPHLDLAVVDLDVAGASPADVMQRIKATGRAVPIVLVARRATLAGVVDAIKEGAFQFLQQPIDVPSLLQLARDATELGAMETTTRPAPRLVGESNGMRTIRRMLARVARSPASTVLLTGESGTGKDVAARTLHTHSRRAGRPFINITCSALPEPLLEAELFGHERGAFTDAKQRKLGLLEEADGGTVFLDEIGEMAPTLQAKLLRFLEERAFRRLGGTQDIRPDVRVVAATNRDLRQAVVDQTFREDLYYRLSVMHIHLPPLRERPEDVEAIAAHLMQRFNEELETSIAGMTPAALETLEAHSWPGNVRELRNAIERAMLLCDQSVLDVEDFLLDRPAESQRRHVFELPPEGVDLRALERSLVEQALDRTGGNQTRAAKLLGVNRDKLRYRMAKFGLRSK